MTKHFSTAELACKCCGKIAMTKEFLVKLEQLREEFGEPMILSSAYRCDAQNAKFSGGPAHPSGQAVDVLIHGASAWRLLRLALPLGFTGIGLNQKGPKEKRFIHLDTFADSKTRPTVWTY